MVIFNIRMNDEEESVNNKFPNCIFQEQQRANKKLEKKANDEYEKYRSMYARYRDIRELKPQLEKTLGRCKELMTENDQLKHENEMMKGAQENTDSLQVGASMLDT